MRLALNKSLIGLKQDYLFSEIETRVRKFKLENPTRRVISLGIGDVTLPLSPTVVREMERAVLRMGTNDGFLGYGSAQGDIELRRAIAEYYSDRDVLLDTDEIFVSDGAKSDLGGLCDLFGDCTALVCEPVYPVYVDVSLMHGRRVRHLRAGDGAEGSLPSPDGLEREPFLIYLCSPNNPSGAVFSYAELEKWVDFALCSGSVIIFDAAYEAFICEKDVPHSIFEIPRAKECAIEVGSFSKMAGFTGIRCGWSIVPRALPLHSAWKRRQATKFNGASRISQSGAIAALSKQGLAECRQSIDYYMKNAQVLADLLSECGIEFTGGRNAPYLWVKCPEGEDSWQLFDRLLNDHAMVVTPGVGFGRAGEGYFRLSAFASSSDTDEAVLRLKSAFDG